MSLATVKIGERQNIPFARHYGYLLGIFRHSVGSTFFLNEENFIRNELIPIYVMASCWCMINVYMYNWNFPMILCCHCSWT